MKYFIHINGQQLGPFEENELIAQNITPSTMVWSEGMESWMPAGQVAGLSHLFQNAGSQQQPPYSQPAYQQPQPQQYGYGAQPPMPDTHLVWAILTTLFCCLPFGIVSIVKASQVSSAYHAGNYQQAEQNSRDAKKWAIISASVGLIGGFLYFIAIASLGLLSAI